MIFDDLAVDIREYLYMMPRIIQLDDSFETRAIQHCLLELHDAILAYNEYKLTSESEDL